MRRALIALVALGLGLVLALPVLAQDDELDRLLQLRQATLEELTDVSLRAAEVELRQGSPHWIAIRADDGSVVQIGMDRIDELVPWLRMALADQDAAPALWAALGRHVPEAALAALAPSFLVREEWAPYVEGLRSLRDGRLEDVDADLIRQLLRSALANEAVRARLDVDANYRVLGVELEEQREALHVLLQLLDADIEARGGTLPAEPSAEPSADPCEADGENAIDVLCADWGDQATPGPAPEVTWEPSLPPTEIEALPSPTPEPIATAPPSPRPSPEPTLTPEPTPGQEREGVQYDALEGLTTCDVDDPDCVEATPEPCGEADMWCQDADAGASPAPLLSDGGWCAGFAQKWGVPAPSSDICACFDEEEHWLSWRANFGEALPEWCASSGSEPADGPEADDAGAAAASEPPPTSEPDPLDELVDAFSLWNGCWATPWGRLRLDEDAGGHVGGTLVWFDAEGERRARLELDPLIGDYPDRLGGTMLDGPPTQAIACPTASDGTLQWASGRIDYTMSGRTFAGSFIPCGDYDGFGSLPLTGTWEATLDECSIAP